MFSRRGAPERPAASAAAGAVVFDPTGRLLVVRRATEPGRGRWTVPGGRVEPGESGAAACVREVAEETGLAVRVVRLLGTVHRSGPGYAFEIEDYLCVPDSEGPEPLTATAGDDAAEVRWVDRVELAALPLVDGLWAALEQWDVLPN